jgi:molybdopterin converting factor small subunit
MEVRLFATLRESRDSKVHVQWYEGMDGHALLKSLGIDAEDVAVFLINGKHSKPEALLNADDIIALFPPVGGG